MNFDTFDKISNILWGVIIACGFAMMFCINSTIATAVVLAIAVGCLILKDWLFKKVCEKNNSRKRRHK